MSEKTAPTPGFLICGNKGFHITFENEWTVSVQFGGGNYCENYGDWCKPPKDGPVHSRNAELAAWDGNGDWFEFEDGNEVAGYKSVSDAFEIMERIKAMPKAAPKENEA